MRSRWLLAMLGIATAAALTPSPATSADKVSIAILRFVSSAPVFIAQDRGYFAAEGIELELKYFNAAQPIAVAVATGETDFGVTAFTAGFFNLAGKGVIKVIAAQSREEPGFEFSGYMASAKAYQAGLRSTDKLPGHSFGLTQVGSSFHYMLGKLAEKRGFKLSDLQLKPLQSVPNLISALKGGQIDAVILPAQFLKPLESEGVGKILGWVGDETPWQLGALFATSKIVADRRPVVERFVRAYLRGAKDYAQAFLQRDANKNIAYGPETDAVIAVLMKFVAPDPTPASIKAAAPFIDAQGRLDVGDIYSQVRWYQAEGQVEVGIDAKSFIDLSFVPGHYNLPK
jgi:NitT/TauT family transport system substrate-binding protein